MMMMMINRVSQAFSSHAQRHVDSEQAFKDHINVCEQNVNIGFSKKLMNK